MHSVSLSSSTRQMPTMLKCLICGHFLPKNSFLIHIAEHLNYRQHKCQNCDFESITMEEMADHEASNPDHMGQLYALRNPYMDRVCRFVYNDCDYGEKNGGDLQKVLKRRLVSALEEESQQLMKSSTGTAVMLDGTSTAGLPMRTEECALPSPKGMQNCGEGRTIDRLKPQHQQQQSATATIAMMPFQPQHCQQQQQWSSCISATAVPMHFNHGTEPPVTTAEFNQMKNEFTAGCSTTTHPSETFGTEDDSMGIGCSVLEKFIAQHQPQMMTTDGNLFDGNEIAPQEGTEHGQQQQLNPFFYNEILVGNPNLEEEIGEEEERGKVRKSSGGKKKYKETFENVRCLKCAQWVKGRGICLLYHMNTRHLKLPLYRCRACPRDFFYVTDTTAKNHIRSFHANDLSLLENNYAALSKILHNSRREFFGLSKSEKKAAGKLDAAKKAKEIERNSKGMREKTRKVKAGKKVGERQPKRQPRKETINFRERPQAGSGTAGNSSHVQCNQCGELVATIYSSQLTHINTKHLHLPIFECRICQRQFESLGSSAAVMHVKSIHGKGRTEAELNIADQRDDCLKQLNERYREFFS